MGGTRIIVLQLKDIIKSALFAIVGIALIILLIYLFVPRNQTSESAMEYYGSAYIPGTYSAKIMLQNEPVDVDVTVSGSHILAVELKNMKPVQETLYPLFPKAMDSLAREIVKTQSTSVVPADEIQFTGKLLLTAVDGALARAKTPAY